jgi:hypothetical protein
MSENKCECSLSISIGGDGCRYCQPQEYIDRAIEGYNELESEYDELKESFELFVNKKKDFVILQGINPCEWASYRDAVKSLGK